jgi:CheY-like chemotaxis protein
VPTVLIVEDDNFIRQFIVINIKMRGYEALEAQSAQEGLDLLKIQPPQLLILDIKLPGMTGWEMLKAIDDDPVLPKVPVIVITASSFPNQGDDYLYSNIVEKLTKPFDAAALVRAVGAVC